MDKDTYEKRKAFAGEKIPSMKRRFVGHDYTRRGIYMVTLTVEGRKNFNLLKDSLRKSGCVFQYSTFVLISAFTFLW